MRRAAVRALGTSRDAGALEALLRLVRGGTSWFGKPKLAPRTPVVLAVFRVLSTVWSSDAEASRLLDLARRSSDPELRQAAQEVSA